MIRIIINHYHTDPANAQIVANLHAEYSPDNGATWTKLQGTERNSKINTADVAAGLAGLDTPQAKVEGLKALIIQRAQQNDGWTTEALQAKAAQAMATDAVGGEIEQLIGAELLALPLIVDMPDAKEGA